jgi:hypothetical protein
MNDTRADGSKNTWPTITDRGTVFRQTNRPTLRALEPRDAANITGFSVLGG